MTGLLRAAFARHVDSFNRQDLAAVLDGFTEDAVWVTGTSVFRGRAELTELFEGAFRIAPVLRPVSVLVADGRVAAELGEHLVHDGVAADFAIAGFYTFAGELIRTATIYREGSAELDP